MIQIAVYKQNGQREYLDLPVDFSLKIDSKSPHFDYELSIGTYSYPAELPWSDRNRRLLGAPEMLESVITGTKNWTVDIIVDGITEINEGVMTLIGTKGDFRYQRGTYVVSISGMESRYGNLIKNKTLRDLVLGGTIFIPSVIDCRQFATGLMKGSYQQYNYIAFAPVYMPDFIDESRDDYTSEFLASQTVNNIVYNGSSFSQGWTFGRLKDLTLNDVEVPGQAKYRDYASVPFLRLMYVFKKCFEEFGYQVYGDFLNDIDYKDLYIFNNVAIEVYGTGYYDINRIIEPTMHVPDMTIVDFLTAVSLTFNLSIVFTSGNKVQLKYRTGQLVNPVKLDVTADTFNLFDAQQTDVATGGVSFEWKWDNSDALPNDRVRDIDKNKLRAIVQLQQDLSVLTLTPAAANGDLVYVISENYYYRMEDAWRPYSEGQQNYTTGKGDLKISPQLSPLLQYIDGNVTPVPDMCWSRNKGSYVSRQNARVTTDFSLRLFYIKTMDKYSNGVLKGYGVPTSFTNSYDPNSNTKRVKTSLSWTAPDSIYKRHHKPWFDMLQTGWSVKTSFLSSVRTRTTLKGDNTLKIGNNYFLIDTQSVTHSQVSTIDATLIRI